MSAYFRLHLKPFRTQLSGHYKRKLYCLAHQIRYEKSFSASRRFWALPFCQSAISFGMQCKCSGMDWAPRGGRVLPYKGLMGTRGEPGYVFRDFCLKQGIEFNIFCLYQGIDLSIFVLNRKNVLNRVSKIGILS